MSHDDRNFAGSRPANRAVWADGGPPSHGFRRFQEAAADLVDMVRLGAPEDFRVSAEMVHLGKAVLVNSAHSPIAMHRSRRHVSSSGIDLFQITMYVSGSLHHEERGRIAEQRPGDICIIDLAQPNRTFIARGKDGSEADGICLMLPRAMLAPLLAAPDDTGGLLLPREGPQAQLLGAHLMGLRRHAAQLNDHESQAAVQAAAHLAAGGFGYAPDAAPAVAQSVRAAMLTSIKRHIERHLSSPNLGVASLCRAFRLSRSALYRLFDEHDGVTNYIQMRRLYRSFEMLVSREYRGWRMIEFALEAQFGSDAAFNRAFRRQFGRPPGEVQRDAHPGRVSGSVAPLPMTTEWVRGVEG